MKYALLVIACLANDPSSCQEYMSALPQVTNATACHLVGRLEASRWEDSHPGQQLSDAYCIVLPENKTMTAALEAFRRE